MGLAERIRTVQADITAAAIASGRSPEDVTLVAVSKTVSREVVDSAYALGLRHFGENRVQDSVKKYEHPLPEDAILHLIGQLQSNKVRPALRIFQMIESVDRLSLIEALEREAEIRNSPAPVLLQVNIAGEEQKSGCPPDEALTLAQRIADSPWMDLQGLMTIAPLVDDSEDVRPVFAGLRGLRDQLRGNGNIGGLEVLSMGMSNDYPVAIAEGATLVRVGRAIFGDS
ncbi:MAG: YggS family pyridoxal phosphate-dependent enzyme [Chloroflexota bacterium]